MQTNQNSNLRMSREIKRRLIPKLPFVLIMTEKRNHLRLSYLYLHLIYSRHFTIRFPCFPYFKQSNRKLDYANLLNMFSWWILNRAIIQQRMQDILAFYWLFCPIPKLVGKALGKFCSDSSKNCCHKTISGNL